ncbi:KH domain-containing, RNA-binding, signal transduction-associated protein 2-like isoform X2 [Tubulanus polymorphus]
MAILGKGSMRDKDKEEEQRKEGGKYAHLSEELHVQVEVYAPPAEAHSRLAHALSELKRYLIPELNDDIRQQQLEELAYYNGDQQGIGSSHTGPPRGAQHAPVSTPVRGRGRGRPPVTPARGSLLATPGARGRGTPPAVRGRGAVRPAPARAPPVPAPRYEEEYAYEDYGAEAVYDSYDAGYSQTDEYYDYGHGQGRGYDSYGETWTRPSAATKAPPPSRPPKTDYRAHPYPRPAY